MNVTITCELDQRTIDWMQSEVELNKLYNAVDAAIDNEDYDLAAEIGDQAIPLPTRFWRWGSSTRTLSVCC